jgi:hypothetical protein
MSHRMIRADQVKRGDVLVDLIGGGTVRQDDGRWPTVLSVSATSDHPPTVHIETSDRPGRVHRLDPPHAVIVQTGQG